MFRLINVRGRAALEVDGLWFDLAELADDDRFCDPMAAIARSSELHRLALRCDRSQAGDAVDSSELEAPVPRPRQVFGIGLNYADHTAESGFAAPPAPLTFTKFPSSIAAPFVDVPLTGEMVDWEVEVVVVIGQRCSHVAIERAWDAVAGLTLGQDISDRHVQMMGSPPQFSLGKSFPAFAPVGPAVVSVDSFVNPDDIAISCEVSGEKMQDARSSQMIFPVSSLVAYLSSICTLEPGDLIFTGTPQGVGMARNRFLRVGDVILSTAEGIGQLRNQCVAGTGPLNL
jgi:2-keto-4-pentenoate hydratase/2-oxohepta-3-ene-1,7-dioic acid hydratase in catechol pathway